MERVKLPREVAEALDDVKYMGLHNIIEQVVNMHAYEVVTSQLSDIRHHFRADWRLLAEALVNGYEVEETPEEKVRKLFDGSYPGMDAQYRAGIRHTLDALGISMKGVNDHD